MNIERKPEQSNPDELVFENGIPGLWGANGKFHPITTDMGVEIKGEANDPWEKPRLEPTIPNVFSQDSEHPKPIAAENTHSPFTPDNWDTISALMRIINDGYEGTV